MGSQDVQPPRERQKKGVFIVADHTTCPNAPWSHRPSVTSCSPTTSKTAKVTRPTKGGTTRLKRIKDCFPKQNRFVVLKVEVEVPLCIDSGADRCCLDESCFDRLVNVKSDIMRVKLDEPLECTMSRRLTRLGELDCED